MSDTQFRFGTKNPCSLTALFEPPEQHIGAFGWVCGYSADMTFLNNAVERFSRQTAARRRATGDIALALILDPGHPRISTVDVPAVLHLPIIQPQSFSLMHAKVALLGFRHIEDPEQWRLRLIVSTGNWTRQTVEDSLDLAAVIEVGWNELTSPDNSVLVADISKGGAFISALRNITGPSALPKTTPVTVEAIRSLDKWLEVASATVSPSTRSRFVDSRSAALLPQIVERISPGKRNYLYMGSAYYEGSDGRNEVPRVPDRIVKSLRDAGLLTQTAEVELYVNPDNCQAIAGAMDALQQRNWIIRAPGQAHFSGAFRALHAKFIFGATWTSSSNRCINAWLYLGSGNLTHPGLLQSGQQGGNIEAALILAPQDLVWLEDNGSPNRAVRSHLPIDWDNSPLISGGVSAGEEMLIREPAFTSPPVPYFTWSPISEQSGRLIVPSGTTKSFDVRRTSTEICERDGLDILWPDQRPDEVVVSWEEDGRGWRENVVVLDEYGRIAGAAFQAIALDQAWAILADFPLPPIEEPDGDIEPIHPTMGGPAKTNGSQPGSYAIRNVMSLIERIADRQTILHPGDWTAWCVRLEQTLSQSKDDADLAMFRSLQLNPISALRAAPFRPDFACDRSTQAGVIYEEMLDRLESKWLVAEFESMGV